MATGESSNAVFDDNSQIFALMDEIHQLAKVNVGYYKLSNPGCVRHQMHSTLQKLLQHLDAARPGVKRISTVAPLFDFKPSLPANGYHSLLTVFRKCCHRIFDIIRFITIHRNSWLFDTFESQRNLDEFVTSLGQLRACFHYMERLNTFCVEGHLFPDESNLTEDEYASAVAIMYEFETLNPESFYGRCLAFQYAQSMFVPLTVIHQALACHSRIFSKSNGISKVASGLVSVGMYLRNIDERAKQVVTVTRECNIDFCQSFWSLSDNPTLVQLSLFACPGVDVDSVINIPFEEVELNSLEPDIKVVIKPPCPENYKTPYMKGPVNHHVSARLLSHKLRSGQEAFLSKMDFLLRPWKKAGREKSPYLIIHLHGGGFVGQSSGSHEVYLRSWAMWSDVPILSVDYSYAPQFKAPYQVEETFFAYCWALKNCHLLGSTAERVVVVGDSAGGNLAIGVGLMAATRGVRIPDAVYSIYGSLLIQYKPGPSRMLAIIDPLIPLGMVSVCLQAYLGTVDDSENKSRVKFEDSSEGEYADDELDDTQQQQHINKTQLPPSSASTSPSFASAMATGVTKTPKHTLSSTMMKPSQIYHHRNDSGCFDSSSSSATDNCSTDDEKKVNYETNAQLRILQNKAKEQTIESENQIEFPSSTDGSDGYDDTSDNLSCAGGMQRTSLAFDGYTKPSLPCNDIVASYAQLKTFKVSPMGRSLRNNPGDSPFISPVLTPDNLLCKLNRVHITACHMDPLLDDSITFACRVRDAGVPVDLDLIPDLPHGFLNFVMFSEEAASASRRCLSNVMCLLKGLPCD